MAILYLFYFSRMEKEYNLSAKKEEEIKSAFERIMEKTGIKKPEDLLIVFNSLYEKVGFFKVRNLSLFIESNYGKFRERT